MVLRYLFKIVKLIFYQVAFGASWIITVLKFKLNGVVFKYDFIGRGIPIISVSIKGSFSIGSKFSFNSGKFYNMIGRQQQCFFIITKGAELTIGDNVGLSSTAIVCHEKITIHDNVRIGGGVVIYDTDFHSLDFEERTSVPEDLINVKTAPVIIEKSAFIGAHTIILKGVRIGENTIIGAGSVVSKNIPPNEIWAGNPIKFLKKI